MTTTTVTIARWRVAGLGAAVLALAGCAPELPAAPAVLEVRKDGEIT